MNKLRVNLLSAVIGIAIGIPTALYAQSTHQQPEIVKETRYVYVPVVEASEPTFQVYEITEDDLEEEMFYDSLELLAMLVEAEAEDQDLIGKRLVVDTVLNRVDCSEWPDCIEDVIMQPGQFTSVWNGRMDKIKEPSEESYEAVRLEIEERLDYEVVYFTAGGFGKYGTPLYQHMDHYFSGR